MWKRHSLFLCSLSFFGMLAGKALNSPMKALVFGGSRLSLISFGYDFWFLGFCIIYLLFGLVLTWEIAQQLLVLLLPLTEHEQQLERNEALWSRDKQTMRFSDFAPGLFADRTALCVHLSSCIHSSYSGLWSSHDIFCVCLLLPCL